MYKIRIILDTKKDVIRTLLVKNNSSLEELHYAIATSFGFNGQEMASFYKTDAEWNQGEEIPLFDMEGNNGLSMNSILLNHELTSIHDKLIYVYDFLAMWTFYVEIIDINEETSEDPPKVILSVGDVPDIAPEREFVAENQEDNIESDFEDDFESFDDFDYNEY